MSSFISFLSEPFAPILVTAGFLVAVYPWLNRDHEWVRAVVVFLTVALSWRYMYWRLVYSLPPLAFSAEWLVGIVFVVVELCALIGGTITMVILAKTSSRSAEADANKIWLQSRPAPLVDVFICTYNEEESILETTIVAALALDHDRFRVWVLDDGRRAWLEELCRRKGCRYLMRPDNTHAKAGNINHALDHVATLDDPPEYIAIFDADFAVARTFLKRTLSLFRDPSIGLVQTPQHFSNPDPIQSNLTVTSVLPDEQRFFFEVLMPSRDAWGMAFCCGTSSVMRFSELRKVGGFPTDSVTEDYLLTLRLQEFGHRTVYLNERLSVGLAPEGLKEYTTQRSRWCLGLVQIVRGQYCPLRLSSRIPLRYRFSLAESFLYWAASFPFRFLCVVIPSVYWLFGVRAVHAELADAISAYFPYFISQVAAVIWISRGRMLPMLTEVSQLLIVPDILKAVYAGLLRPKGQKFKVTPKGGRRDEQIVQWRTLALFGTLIVATIVGVGYTFLIDETRFVEEGAILTLFWTWYNLCVLVICTLVCIEQPRYRKHERYPGRGYAILAIDDRAYNLSIADISVGGLLLRGTVPESIGVQAEVMLPGRLRVRMVIARKEADFLALEVESADARDAMVRHIHSGRYGGTQIDVNPLRVAKKIFERATR